MRAVRTTAGSALAAIQIGGYGFCTGRIVQVALCTWKKRPSKVTSSSVHSRLINSSDSSMRGTRSRIATPKPSNSTSR
jgi:hypothetical protein